MPETLRKLTYYDENGDFVFHMQGNNEGKVIEHRASSSRKVRYTIKTDASNIRFNLGYSEKSLSYRVP